MAKAISARREKLRSNKLKIFSRRHSLLCYRAMEGCGSKYPLKKKSSPVQEMNLENTHVL